MYVHVCSLLQEEALVVSVGTELDLTKGRVSKVISDKAGPELQEECKKTGRLLPGEVLETEAYQMPHCSKILHACTPSWKGYDESVPVSRKF